MNNTFIDTEGTEARKEEIASLKEFSESLNDLKQQVDKLEALVQHNCELHAEQMRIDEEFYKHLDQTLLTC